MRDRINLLPQEISAKRRAAKRNFYLISGLIVFMVFMTFTYFVLLVQVKLAQTDLSGVKSQREQLKSTIAHYKIYEDRQDEYRQRDAKYQVAKKGAIKWSNILSKMTMLLPSQTYMTALLADETGVNAEIMSTDYIGVAATIIQFNNIQEFSNNVAISEISKDEDKTGLLKFKITAKFKVANKPVVPKPGTGAVQTNKTGSQ